MAKSASKDLSVLIKDLAQRMEKKFDPEVFFTDLLKMYGTANASIEMALKNERGFNVASKEIDETMARPDIAISLRAYFRFLNDGEDVVAGLKAVRELKEVTGPKHKFQFLICAGPEVLAMYDAVENKNAVIGYKELPGYYTFMLPLVDGRRSKVVSSREADRKACLKLTTLLDTLAECNNIADDEMQKLNSFMVRILFCFFAEDTGVFEFGGENVFSNAFNKIVDRHGTNAKQFFTDLFKVLNTPENERASLENSIAQELLKFPYVNGGLFAEPGYIPDFDIVTRNQFIDCGELSWSEISPAVFGSMFQGAMDKESRRNLGAHYTSEENILKVIKPLFLDDLYEEFEQLKQKAEPLKLGAATAKRADTARSKNESIRRMFHGFLDRIGQMKFLDPACGCGNFLLVTYKELRILENKVLEYINEGAFTDSHININQFYGIEIEDWPVEIAHVSMWLMQHLMNKVANARFGLNISSIPLKSSANIVCANALTTDWNTVLPASECTFILGNPPFGGAKYTSDQQKEWLKGVYPLKHKLGFVDFVTAWFVKASEYMANNKDVRTAFVATNSICQGQQVETLWGLLLERGIHINFAYTSFPWTNEAAGKAAVICVIVGFSFNSLIRPKLMHYDEKNRKFSVHKCTCISPYLSDCSKPEIVKARNTAFADSLNLTFGNMPNDGGGLLFSYHEGKKLLEDHPEINQYLKKCVGSSELMKSEYRYCLWIESEHDFKKINISALLNRINKVKSLRESSTRAGTRKAAATPWRFGELASPANPKQALAVPRVTSQRRDYIPLSYIDKDVICNDRVFMLANAGLYEFGILSSRMHMVWMRLTSGRMKNDYSYLRDLTFNTFVWPEVKVERHDEIEELAKNILRVRAKHITNDLTLGELYSPATMPADLKAAHEKLDDVVEHAYRDDPFKDDEDRLSFLLDLYSKAIDAERKAEIRSSAALKAAKTRAKTKKAAAK